MGMFDFLSGQSDGASYDPNAMQSYQQFQPASDYSSVLGGGAASSATQGLDFGAIGNWAQQMAQKTQYAQNPQSANFQNVLAGGQAQDAKHQVDYQKLLASFGPTQATQPTGQRAPLPGQQRQPQLGQIQQGMAGYIGGGQRLGLLGMVR